jgi:hypothetical protein
MCRRRPWEPSQQALPPVRVVREGEVGGGGGPPRLPTPLSLRTNRTLHKPVHVVFDAHTTSTRQVLPKILNVAILLAVHVLIFGVLGYVMFSGYTMSSCSVKRNTNLECSTFVGNEGDECCASPTCCSDYFSTLHSSLLQRMWSRGVGGGSKGYLMHVWGDSPSILSGAPELLRGGANGMVRSWGWPLGATPPTHHLASYMCCSPPHPCPSVHFEHHGEFPGHHDARLPLQPRQRPVLHCLLRDWCVPYPDTGAGRCVHGVP